MEEYKRIYEKSIVEELSERSIVDFEDFNKNVKAEIEKTTFHFGHPYFNSATIAGVFRMALKKYDSDQ